MVYLPLWNMMEWKSVGMMTFPTEWSHKIPWFQSTSQLWISCMDSAWIYIYIYILSYTHTHIYIYISYTTHRYIYIYMCISYHINRHILSHTHTHIYIYISYIYISYIYISYISCMVVSIRFNWFHVPKPGCPSHKIGTLQDHETPMGWS